MTPLVLMLIAIMILAGIILWLCKDNAYWNEQAKGATMERFGKFDYKITFPNGAQYVGDCTVWHRFPSGKGCDTIMCSFLNDIWTREKWNLDGKV